MASYPNSDVAGARIAVVGGGLAGLATAVAARQCGFAVEIFEARGRLGGRAGSFHDPAFGEQVDFCQHVSMGCCTNWADFCRRTGVADCFRRDRQIRFVAPDGRIHVFSGFPLLPSPLHLVPGLMRLGYLRRGDRLRLARTMLALASEYRGDDIDVESWLRARGASDEALRRFWSPLLVSALGERLDRVSLAAARKVVVDGFFGHREGYVLEVPTVPLGEIYDRRISAWLRERGVAVHLRTPVRQVEGDADGASGIVLSDGFRKQFDFVVVAVPWRAVARVLAESLRSLLPGLRDLPRLEPAPITAVHFWYDRPVLPLPHAVLVDRLSQWIFHHETSTTGAGKNRSEHHYQVVISASRDLIGRDREKAVAQIRAELSEIWPAFNAARLLRWRMVTNPEAVFSLGPGIDPIRPAQQTAIPNLVLAGDWTATGWPATMEGAVRSGYLAVEAMLRVMGRSERVLAADLPRGWFASLLIRDM
ncbi:MAG: FAD-dependent oxidoreductase [Rhodopirellula sp.]|nr:FAD-dependent oxidoreductase [Rhodopirellula sp.]